MKTIYYKYILLLFFFIISYKCSYSQNYFGTGTSIIIYKSNDTLIVASDSKLTIKSYNNNITSIPPISPFQNKIFNNPLPISLYTPDSSFTLNNPSMLNNKLFLMNDSAISLYPTDDYEKLLGKPSIIDNRSFILGDTTISTYPFGDYENLLGKPSIIDKESYILRDTTISTYPLNNYDNLIDKSLIINNNYFLTGDSIYSKRPSLGFQEPYSNLIPLNNLYHLLSDSTSLVIPSTNPYKSLLFPSILDSGIIKLSDTLKTIMPFDRYFKDLNNYKLDSLPPGIYYNTPSKLFNDPFNPDNGSSFNLIPSYIKLASIEIDNTKCKIGFVNNIGFATAGTNQIYDAEGNIKFDIRDYIRDILIKDGDIFQKDSIICNELSDKIRSFNIHSNPHQFEPIKLALFGLYKDNIITICITFKPEFSFFNGLFQGFDYSEEKYDSVNYTINIRPNVLMPDVKKIKVSSSNSVDYCIKFIQSEIDNIDKLVGPPIQVLRLERSGFKWLKNDLNCK